MRDEFNSRNTRVYNDKVKYPQGYIPKIQYWNVKLQEALANGEWSQAEYCMKKLQYFVGSQYVKENQEPHNHIIAGVDFSQSISQLNNL
jgi:hypothetical protein